MSTWMTLGALLAGGSVQWHVVVESVRDPTYSTRSASARQAFAYGRAPLPPTTPIATSLVSAMLPLPLIDVATGMLRVSASAVSSFHAPDVRTPPPATITGRVAAASSVAARSMGT